MRILPQNSWGWAFLVVLIGLWIYVVCGFIFFRRRFQSLNPVTILREQTLNRPTVLNENERLFMPEDTVTFITKYREAVRSKTFCPFCQAPVGASCTDWTGLYISVIHEERAAVYAAAIDPGEPEQSNLVDHARREMEIIGEDEWTKNGILKCIRAFADMGHSGGSASVAIPMIQELLFFRPLSPLTDDPEEWQFVAEDVWGKEGGIWQNRRDGEAFSNNGGKTYYLLREGASDRNRRPMHESKPSAVKTDG